MKHLKVVCGIIWNEGKVFLARRKPEKSMGGYWEFPGGKIEAGETPEEALTRELKEELGMTVIVHEHFFTSIYSYENFTIELIAYNAELITAHYHLTDHDLYEWKKPKNLKDFHWAPADVAIVEKLMSV